MRRPRLAAEPRPVTLVVERHRGPLLLNIEGERLDAGRSVRVVVGEAAGLSPLRSTLEHEGFDVVGYAASAVGLEAVLAGVRPEAIVLDAQIGVSSLVAARQLAPAAKVFVVWPSGVSAVMADERIEPSRVATDLAPAIRRSVMTSLDVEPITIRYEPPVREPRLVLTPNWDRPRRTHRRAVALAVAATFLLGAAAFAIAAPQWRHESSERRTPAASHKHPRSIPTSTGSQHEPGGATQPGSTSPTGCTQTSSQHGTPPAAHDNNGKHLGQNGHGPGCAPGQQGEHTNNGHQQTPGGEHYPPGGAGHGHGQGQGQGTPQRPSPGDHPTHP